MASARTSYPGWPPIRIGSALAMRMSFNGGKSAHRVAGELVAVAGVGAAGGGRDHELRLLGRLDVVLGPVGELHRDARHHPGEPQARVSPTLNGTSVSCSSAGTVARVAMLSSAVRTGAVRIGRRRLARHLKRNQRGQVVDRRDQQPFADAARRRSPGARRQDGVAASESGTDSRFSTVMPCFFRASLVMVFSISAEGLAGSAISRTKTLFCWSSKPGNLVAGCKPGRRHQPKPRPDREHRVRGSPPPAGAMRPKRRRPPAISDRRPKSGHDSSVRYAAPLSETQPCCGICGRSEPPRNGGLDAQ